ncbi:hypothetical protein MSG28_004973 [Choristoneura fumiferana]|uniref:Uncharacterized protein n=1 Tax=Choristoneura fumiferana TaxID=7141 RepID=A0ACC0JPL8_CHOFU|nr:hypothetical protein MSG28_004973 [Choristoneura fumiferana]
MWGNRVSPSALTGTSLANLWVALGVTFVTLIVMACCGNVRRQAPMNFIFLGIFTLAESFLLGAISSTRAPEAVSIVSIFVRNNTLQLVYACIGALLFSMYLVYDTQLMMGGKHKYSISPEEYIFAALNLYLDIVNIFLYILTIISATKD